MISEARGKGREMLQIVISRNTEWERRKNPERHEGVVRKEPKKEGRREEGGITTAWDI